MQYEYFYGAQAEQFSFYRIPKALFTEPNFRELSTDAKVLYGILLDRMSLSLKNQWLDAQNKVYIIFTVEEIMDAYLLPYLMKQAKGFVINPSGFNLLLTREQLQRIMGAQAQSVRPNLEAMMAQAAAAQAQRNAQNNAANDEVKDHVDEAETTDAETDHEE